ncbi:hypothetical protein CAL7716_005840 [Calothrix sp. PCC 7716]|nr:hypothetical protein CAL7716_005840 [Calothrix sp. PCC 7716]
MNRNRHSIILYILSTLVKLASSINPELATTLREAAYLSQYNLTYRYPSEASDDFNPSPGELKKAYRLAFEVYQNFIDAMPTEITGQSQE